MFKNMKPFFLLSALCAALVSCGSADRQAARYLDKARIAYEQGDYNAAKLHIDSIKTLYPKAYDTRREGNRLMQQVVLAEQQRSLLYLDSTLQVRLEELSKTSKQFVFEQDTAYEELGRYLHPKQVIEQNLGRSFLRFQTDERGIMTLTSIYCGGSNIHHTAVRVTAPDDSYAETPSSRDSYETTDLGTHIEKADYRLGQDGGVIEFIALNKDKNLRVTYLGERTYHTNMMPADREAAASVLSLSRLLSSIEEIKKQMQEARLKINFVQEKMKRETGK